MILISLQPFEFKKIAALVFAILGLSTIASFASPLYLTVPSTPYDHQMSRIQPVLYSQAAASEHSDLSLAIVNHWMTHLREIPYGYSSEWKLPNEVESAPSADCKGKAVALYEKMQANGAHNVRLVIGKRSWTSQKTHAWLEWNVGGASYVLDPTWNWSATRAERMGSHSYIPFYAYAGAKKYRAAAAPMLYAKN